MTLNCSFCTRSQHEVKTLVAGPGVFICDDCVRLGARTIKEQTYLPSVPMQVGAKPANVSDMAAMCSFCPKPKSDPGRLFAGGGVPTEFICAGCLQVCEGVIQRREV
jgi:ATP-dependent protease Clp ATPase subunit